MSSDGYLDAFKDFVEENKLTGFYPPGSVHLAELASKAPGWVEELQQKLGSREIAEQMIFLALYRTVILLDDSSSMGHHGDKKINSLEHFLKIVVQINRIYQPDGLKVRWLNCCEEFEGVTKKRQISDIIGRNDFYGCTKLGGALQKKVLDTVLKRANKNKLHKPVVVMIITDGQPDGEPRGKFKEKILAARDALSQTRYGENAVAYQIAHVGKNTEAIEFLQSLEDDPDVGHLLHVTSEEGIEKAETLNRTGEELTHQVWVAKLMLGAIVAYFGNN